MNVIELRIKPLEQDIQLIFVCNWKLGLSQTCSYGDLLMLTARV